MTTPDVRRAGNGNGKITREAVLAAALEIIDRDGADALSMRPPGRSLDRGRQVVYRPAREIIDREGADALSRRRLARALDRDPRSFYRHAPGKAALLDVVAETVLA